MDLKTNSELYKELHGKNSGFGTAKKIPEMAQRAIEELKPNSILDFGCGKGAMTEALKNLYPEKLIKQFFLFYVKLKIKILRMYCKN